MDPTFSSFYISCIAWILWHQFFMWYETQIAFYPCASYIFHFSHGIGFFFFPSTPFNSFKPLLGGQKWEALTLTCQSTNRQNNESNHGFGVDQFILTISTSYLMVWERPRFIVIRWQLLYRCYILWDKAKIIMKTLRRWLDGHRSDSLDCQIKF